MSELHDGLIENLIGGGQPYDNAPIRSWPNRLLMEIECITDPDELEAACNLGLKRVALLRSGK